MSVVKPLLRMLKCPLNDAVVIKTLSVWKFSLADVVVVGCTPKVVELVVPFEVDLENTVKALSMCGQGVQRSAVGYRYS